MKSPLSFLRLQPLVLVPLLLLSAIAAKAQVAPAGVIGRGSLDVFAMYKYTNPDLIYSPDNGITYGAEFKLGPILHVQPGIEFRGEEDFNYKYIRWHVYSGGPQFHFMPSHRLSPYAGVLFGLAPATFFPGGGSDTATDVQVGGGATYRLTHRFAAMSDFQYHFMDFGTHNGVDTTFTPWSVSVGVQYRIF
jgi:opacity protein-like surface antigen